MSNRLSRFWRQPMSRRLQSLSFRWARIMMALIHRPRLAACGTNNIVMRPLFWMPECISLGNDVLIWPGCRLEGLESESGRAGIHLADGVTIQQNCHITAAASLHIGAGTTILCDAVITDIDHRYDEIGTSVARQPIEVEPTSIGRNCFIGAGAKILAGTRLGEHCIVGANAVVRGTFPPGSVIVGIPGRIVKQYDEATKSWTTVRSQKG